MSLPEQLRAIADRIEAAETEILVAKADLWRLAGQLPGEVVDMAADPGLLKPGSSIEDDPAPIQQAGSPVAQAPAAVQAADSAPPGLPVNRCPECGKQTPTAAGLVTHRSRVHHVKPRPTPAQRLADRKKPVTNGDSRPFSSPIGKAAIPPVPVIRHGEEWFLCTRCPERFRTAEALKGHMMKGHPPVAAASTRPFGEQPVMEHSGGGGFRD